MCGIAGITSKQPELVARMADRLSHRGPDDEGTWHDELVSLSHRRLSILDLSERGHQPMTWNAAGSDLVITYNGELYDFKDVRRVLEALGMRFTSECDTEVLLAAYAQWGARCVERFNGMWAFGLYDRKARKLLLSRDRFGKKPLYYAMIGDDLIFASEIKALLLHPGLARKPNQAIVADYLYRGMVGHTTDTFFEGVKMLPAGCTAEFDLQTRRLRIDRYYDLPLGDRRVSPDEVRDTLRRAVQRRLVSDVHVSLSLSGGIDSSAVAAFMATGTDQRIMAFTTQSGESRGDETEFVKLLVARYDNLELRTNPLAPESFFENYRKIIYHMDEPFSGHVPYVRWEIARTCHEHDRKVMLNGEGADELIGGYWISLAFFLSDLFRRGRWRRLAKELRALRGTNELGTVVATFLAVAMLPSGFAIHQTERKYKRLKAGFDIRLDYGDVSSEIRAMKQSDERQMRKRLVTELILPHLLICNDKMSMANSVEARVPFLDYEFAELALSMASEDLVVDGLRKHPLREAVRGIVPDAILDRKRKDYFSAPTSKYLRSERMGLRIHEVFADARSACFMDPTTVLRQFEAYQHKRSSVSKNVILRALWLEEWMRVFDVAA